MFWLYALLALAFVSLLAALFVARPKRASYSDPRLVYFRGLPRRQLRKLAKEPGHVGLYATAALRSK
jgi:hypothetical protein